MVFPFVALCRVPVFTISPEMMRKRSTNLLDEVPHADSAVVAGRDEAFCGRVGRKPPQLPFRVTRHQRRSGPRLLVQLNELTVLRADQNLSLSVRNRNSALTKEQSNLSCTFLSVSLLFFATTERSTNCRQVSSFLHGRREQGEHISAETVFFLAFADSKQKDSFLVKSLVHKYLGQK